MGSGRYFPESIQTLFCSPAARRGGGGKRTCKHSSSARTPEAALVSLSRPCRDLISGRTFDAWRRSTRLNSFRTAGIPQTFRLMNYVRSIKMERAEVLSRETCNCYSRYDFSINICATPCTCIIQRTRGSLYISHSYGVRNSTSGTKNLLAIIVIAVS